MSEYAITLTSCPPLEDVVLALGSELTTPETRALTAHLRHCAVCRASIGEVEGALTVVAIARAREVASSLDFSPDGAAARKQRFMGRLDEVRRQHAWRRSAMRRWLPVAAMISAIVTGVMFHTQTALGEEEGFLERVKRAVRQTLGLAGDRSTASRQPPPVGERMTTSVPRLLVLEPVRSSNPRQSASERPAPSSAVRPPRRALAGFVDRTFRNKETGQEFLADLPLRAGSVTRLLNELCVVGRLNPAAGGERGASPRADIDSRALKLYEGLRHNLNFLDSAFHLIFGAQTRIVPTAGLPLPPDWRQRAKEASVYSTRLERLIDDLLTFDDVQKADESPDGRDHPIFVEIDQTFAGLWNTVHRVP
jgi:hypothetical protein